MIRRSSNHWKFWVVLFPIIGTCALANFPGGMKGFFGAWYGNTLRSLNFDNTLLMEFKFDSDATDSSGNANNIDAVSNVTFTGGTAYFPGGATNNYLRKFSFAGIRNYTNFTVSFWAKNLAWSDNFPRLTEKGQNNEWTITYNGSVGRRLQLQVNDSGAIYSDTTINHTTNVWTHYVFRLSSSSNWTFYQNTTSAWTLVRTITANNTNDIYIGGNLSSFSTAIDYGGYIDNWRYYTKALSTNEIQLLFNEGYSQ